MSTISLETKNFGKLDIDTEKIINFKEGIPGFEEAKRFVEIANDDESNPLHWLQAVDDGDLTFVIVNPFLVIPNYEIELDENIIQELQIKDQGDVVVFNIVAIPEKKEDIRINLKSPIIINVSNKFGKQIVLDNPKYTYRHNLIEEINKAKSTNM